MADEPELQPCPKCGHDGDGLNYAVDDVTHLWQVTCLCCGYEGAEVEGMGEARKIWNAQ